MIKACNALNAMFVARLLILLSRITLSHIPARHNFLNIQLIFNPDKIVFAKAETQGFSTIPSILYMLILSIQE